MWKGEEGRQVDVHLTDVGKVERQDMLSKTLQTIPWYVAMIGRSLAY
jgi:hypothetical protein